MPRVSVLLPVYNAAPYVGDAIDSILQQTFNDFELIIINDGSEDGSLAILEERAARDRRVRLYSRENRGLVVTLNEALERADGEWVARLDADDISHPRRLDTQVKMARDRGLQLVGTSFSYFGDIEKKVWYPKSDRRIRHAFYVWGRTFCHPSILASRQLIGDIGYEQRYRHAEDMALWSRILHRTDAVVGNVPEVLYSYRAHNFQVSIQQNEAQVAMSELILREALDEIACQYSENEFLLHCRTRRRQAFNDAEQLEAYGVFLQRLYTVVARNVGHDDKIFEHWLRIYRKNLHLKPARWFNAEGFGIRAPKSWRYNIAGRIAGWRTPKTLKNDLV